MALGQDEAPMKLYSLPAGKLRGPEEQEEENHSACTGLGQGFSPRNCSSDGSIKGRLPFFLAVHQVRGRRAALGQGGLG